MKEATGRQESRNRWRRRLPGIPAGNRGFSTFEVVTVVVIGLIAATMVVPAVHDSVLRYRLVVAANALASELNAARVLSVSSGSAHTISFDPQDRFIRVVDSAGNSDPSRCTRIDAGISLHLPQQDIRFTSRGTARGGSLQLVNANGEVVVVEVTAAGRTRIGRLTKEGTT